MPLLTTLIIFGKIPLPANVRKFVFYVIKRDGITRLHGIHVVMNYVLTVAVLARGRHGSAAWNQ